ncbi:hypothetical protein EUGRSUZ_A00737 [Eucalyptus grandis]|uniref:Uncharacterized protein n=2 Tax=Eucalyptus grandis TaxID=71139 RepID=A0ACC3M1R2_EUCGR|nr:hypothetical protein EUGRSUZ_A00737 [Eucalyptus grandis]
MENRGGVLMHRYKLGRLLGQGTFAKVHYARNISTGMSVAIMMIDKEKVLKIGIIDQIKQEISVMRLIRHPHTKIYFVMQYTKGGELFNKVAKGKLKEDVAWRYFQQLIAAVHYCHSRGVCHRDLKPENLLLDESGNLKVSDFVLSAIAESKRQDGLLHATCRTPAYVAPEVINRRGHDGSKADIWSCGVILFVLLASYLPFHDSNLMEIISMTKIMESSWFQNDVDSRTICSVREVKESPPLDTVALFSPDEGENSITESKQEPSRLSNLNAFDIISYSAGFDLSGLFEGVDQRKEVWFTVNKPGVLGFDAEIFEIIPAFRLVEMKKPSGDTMEYQKDIVWTWQGEQSPPPPPPPLPNQQLVEQEESHPFYDSTLPVTSSLD